MGNLFASINDNESSSTFSSESSLTSNGLIQANSLRSEARQLHSEAQATSEQSQRAYHSGLRSKAKELSNRKNDLYRQRDEKNRQAAELIFEHFNQKRAEDMIDLHGLHVEEALKYLQRKLNQCRSKNILRLTVITGIGNNSPNRLAKIKPKVEQFARENQLKIISYGGHAVIDLTRDDRQAGAACSRDTTTCTIQ